LPDPVFTSFAHRACQYDTGILLLKLLFPPQYRKDLPDILQPGHLFDNGMIQVISREIFLSLDARKTRPLPQS
jgi:hypothetical protein